MKFDGMFETIENLCETVAPLQVEVWTSPEPLPFERRFEGTFQKLEIGRSWGSLFDCGWFRFSGTVPPGERPEELALRLDVNGELLMVDAAGRPLRALTNLSSIFDRRIGTPEKLYMPLSELNISGGKFEVWADAGCNDLFGALQLNGTVRFAELVRRPARLAADYFDRRFEREAAEAGCSSDGLPVYATGHSHLDLAWLWPLRESRRKGVRTFATALVNQKKYPWYCFGASQPQLYCWVAEQAPELFEALRRREAEGRWELQGAMWVEADTHIPDGESLMRQFIYGQAYWRETFGHEVRTVWLPDIFGYSGSLPGIAKLNGAEYVLTMKNAWNLFNPFPYNAFNWTGIDGSRVLAYRLPEETYNGSANPAAVMKCQRQDAQRAVSGASLMLYGIGDGGAGPGETHLELLARMADRPGFPPVIHAGAEEFFDRIAAKRDSLPDYAGELYLENHQGTFTSCELIKRINRSYEQNRQELEFTSVVWGKPLPAWYDEFEKEVLLMQFHDVLPGTSIERVYREAEERHACWMERIGEWYGTRKEACFFNPTSAPLTRFQKAAEGWRILQLPPFAWGGSRPWNGSLVRGQGNTLDNGVIRVGFDTQGGVAGWFDYRTGRELLTAPALFQLYADKGNAWNIEPGTYDAPLEPGLQLVSQRIYADGPVGCCRQEYRYGNSRMRAEFRLNADASACEVFVTLEWRDPEHLMRFELPGAVDADTAQYAAQYGFEEFSTRSAGSVERAQYEIAAQRWVRIADETAALSLVSDCKYGFSVKNGRLNITLLRCAERPGSFIGKDDKARSGNARYNDLGHHEFAFAFAVDHGDATLPMELAEWLNRPVAAAPETASDAGCKLDWTGGQFAVTMMRPAWQGGGVLLRVYERFGKSGVLPELPGVRLTAVRPDGRALGGISATEFHPFEIKTFRVQFSNNRSSMNQ